MDWFKRYGIPGAYFIMLTIGWVYGFYEDLPSAIKPELLLKLGLFMFLPVGYLITTIQQLCYLRSANGGLHKKAAEGIKKSFVVDQDGNIEDEVNVEALSCLNVAFGAKNLETLQFVQKWIGRRMDVITINRSIQSATILSPFVAISVGPVFIGCPFHPPFWGLIILLSIISLVLFYILHKSKKTLGDQIVIVISELWKIIIDNPESKIIFLHDNKPTFK